MTRGSELQGGFAQSPLSVSASPGAWLMVSVRLMSGCQTEWTGWWSVGASVNKKEENALLCFSLPPFPRPLLLLLVFV